MMNNGAHWASDYPVAIAVGYGLGKRAVAHGRRLVRADAPDSDQGGTEGGDERDLTLVPIPLERGGGLAVSGRF